MRLRRAHKALETEMPVRLEEQSEHGYNNRNNCYISYNNTLVDGYITTLLISDLSYSHKDS